MRLTPLLLAGLLATPALADPVYDMCVRPGNYGKEQCDCAVAKLARSFSPGDRALYEALSAGYLRRRDEGLGMADAWDAAVQSEAMARNVGYVDLMTQANALGRRWSQILEECG